jgi:hypothetical protein
VARRAARAAAGFASRGSAPVEGELVRAAAVDTLYVDVPDTFDRPQLREWQAYAVADGHLAPAFGGGWAIDPSPIRSSS